MRCLSLTATTICHGLMFRCLIMNSILLSANSTDLSLGWHTTMITREDDSAAIAIAVGTALTGGPPHRSQRAELPHWAPALDSGIESHVGERMLYAGQW